MKHILSTTFLALCLLSGCQSKPASVSAIETPSIVQNEAPTSGNLIIFYDSKTGSVPLMQAVKDYGATLVYEYKTLKGIAITPPKNIPIQDSIAYFEKVKGVLAVNQDQILQLQ